jgi:hypothetical protein
MKVLDCDKLKKETQIKVGVGKLKFLKQLHVYLDSGLS